MTSKRGRPPFLSEPPFTIYSDGYRVCAKCGYVTLSTKSGLPKETSCYKCGYHCEAARCDVRDYPAPVWVRDARVDRRLWEDKPRAPVRGSYDIYCKICEKWFRAELRDKRQKHISCPYCDGRLNLALLKESRFRKVN